MRIVHVLPSAGEVAAQYLAQCCDGLTVDIQGNHVVVLADDQAVAPTPITADCTGG